MAYRVQPGLYRIGEPDTNAPVLVTANYKLTLDMLRRELDGRDLWILVLNTHGVNVWCAAGKGTFGTDELIKRIQKHRLEQVVNHRQLILPQLGAPGIAAHEIRQATGFAVVYGPGRAIDIPAFLDNGMKADETMRTVTFALRERLSVIPVELVYAMKFALLPMVAIAIGAVFFGGSHTALILRALLEVLGAILIGTVAVPVLLPVLPFRSFTLNGLLAGLIHVGLLISLVPAPMAWQPVRLLVLPVISAWLALNFTGATTFTSLSGVERELRRSVIPMGNSLIAGTLTALGFLLKGWLS